MKSNTYAQEVSNLSGVGVEAVGHIFDNEVDHSKSHLVGRFDFGTKPFIYNYKI
jgi:hypothetical protein